MIRLLLPFAALGVATGCADLDVFAFNGIHCSNVSEETCTKDDPWDRVCLTCEEPYVWDATYDWTPTTLEEGDSVRPIPAEAVTSFRLPTRDGEGELDVVHVKGHGEDPDTAGITVLYSHGNYASIEHYMPRLRFLYEGGYDLVAWDYRGYGKSDPVDYPTAAQLIDDALLLADTLPELGADGPVVVYANSLGAIAALEQAIYLAPCALVLEVPFTGIGPVSEGADGLTFPGGFLTSGLDETALRVTDYPGPLLVMGGDADRTIPPDSIRELYAAAPGDKQLWMLPGVGHGVGQGGGVPEAGMRAYLETISSFLVDTTARCGAQGG